MCRFCEGDCGILVTVENGRPVSAEGDRNHPVSKGHACGKQRAMVDITNDPDRIVHPMKRVAGKLQPISWDQALQEIGAKVRELRNRYGPDALGLYMGNPAAFNYAMLPFITAFQAALGIKNAWSAGSQDCQNKLFAAELMFGSAVYQPYPDVERTDCLIILGSNPVISGGSFINFPGAGKRLKEIDDRGKVYVIDPRRTETARTAGEHIFIRPDTDLFFLMSMLNLIFKDSRYDYAAVSRVAEGIEQLEEAVEPYTPKATEKITGIPARKVAEITDNLLRHSRSALYNRIGTDLGTLPTYTDWLVKAVNLVANRLDRLGCMIFSKQIVGAGQFLDRRGIRNGLIHSRIRGYPSTASFLPAGVMADEILTPGEGQVRGLFMVCGNPMITVPNGAHLEKALKELELFVTLDFYENDTAVHADYILPAATPLEREEINLTSGNFQPIPYVQYVEAVVPPRGEAREDWRILRDLAIAARLPVKAPAAIQKLVGSLPLSPKPLAYLYAATKGVNPIQLRKNPHGVRVDGPHYNLVLGKKVLTRNGLANLDPRALPGILDQARLRFDELKKKKRRKNELLMITARDRRSQNSWIHNCPSMMKNRKSNIARMNPKDAERLGIAGDDRIRVKNKLGQIELPVKVTDNIMAGVIVVPHGWGHNPNAGWKTAAATSGVNSNLLCDDQVLERPSGHPLMNGIPVQVSKVS
jgi:formate dehydrogenase